ncbi:MAG: nuclear transport factor 2 family protein [Acidobacteriota bacterium]|nr:nuclear transport factor 2 family protein [Acidobacteriota bacterium]
MSKLRIYPLALYFSTAIVATILTAGVVCPGLTRADSSQLTKAEALKLHDQFQKATVEGDAATLDKLMAADCIFIHGNGMVQTKAVFTDMLKSGRMKVTSWDMKSPEVILFDGGAIVTGVSDWVMDAPPGSGNRGPMTLHLRVSQIWAHTSEGWQLILDQDTSIAQPPGMRPAAANAAPSAAPKP